MFGAGEHIESEASLFRIVAAVSRCRVPIETQFGSKPLGETCIRTAGLNAEP